MKNSALVDGIVITREMAEKALKEMNTFKPGDLVIFNSYKAAVVAPYVAETLGKAFWPASYKDRVIIICLEDGGVVAPKENELELWGDNHD